jgi:hypothetical protein
MRIKRRQVLAGAVAAGALALAGPSMARPRDPHHRLKGDPEPLQQFGLPEGFYGHRGYVYYVDAAGAAWAPRGLDPHRLVPLDPSTDPAELLTHLRRRHWAWAVEHAVLKRLHAEPALAKALLATALAFERPSALRLRHLSAALTTGRDTWCAVGTDGRAIPIRLARG